MSTGSATSDPNDFSNYKTMGPNYQPSWNPESTTIQKNHKYKVVLFFQMWATKKTPSQLQVPIHPYSSSPPCCNRLPGRKFVVLVSSGWFVGIRFQAIHWGSPRSVWPMLQVSGWSIKGSIFLKVGNGKSTGWPSWSQVSWDFGGCFWKTGLGWVKSHASMS